MNAADPTSSTSTTSAVPDTAFGRVVDGLNAIGSVLIFAVMFLICADVTSRNLANRPIDGVAEMVSMSIIAIVFLQLASTLRHGRMSRADIFIEPLRNRRPRTAASMDAFFALAGLVVCAAIAWASWPVFTKAWIDSEFIGVQGVFTAPTWPVKGLVVLGCWMAAAQYAVMLVDKTLVALGRRTQSAPF